MSDTTKVVVCDKWQLNRAGEGFDLGLEKATKLATGIKTIRSYVEDCNFDAKESGIYYDIDEKLSIDFVEMKGKYAPVKSKEVDPKLLEAREAYKKAFDKDAHPLMKLESINKAIEEAK